MPDLSGLYRRIASADCFSHFAFTFNLCRYVTAGIAYEAAGKGHKWSAFAVTVGIMAILPAHLMRSVAGGYDNEAVAVTAITSTFFFWAGAAQS
jgi:hypothetical protein